jgi:hypothetical protein
MVSLLTVSYKEADPTFMFDTSEDIKEAILNEFGWLDSSGVKVIEGVKIKMLKLLQQN